GEAGDLTISNDTTGAGGNGMGFVKAVDGTNASLTVDGVPISSASNTVTGVIPGVTLTLDSEAPGKSVTISVQANLTNAASAINNFLNTYNTLVQAVNAQFKFDSSTNTAGPLAGDSGLRMLQQKLLADMAYSIPGNNGFVNLESIGISMQNDGTLTVDNTKLNDALTNHFADVQNLFQSSSPVGLAQNLKTDLMQLASPSQGPLSLEINFANQTINDLTTQIQDFEDRLQLTQQQLTTEYTNINNTLLQLPSLLNQINSQIDGLNLYGKKS
ncbi:MAG TPA: flagellar filament capping protein FliD, partial [Terriglobia bacterium]|nr:flagellar filament capping protein FliD [Terriglobia bacterium]